MYDTIVLLVTCTVVHFYTTGHLTAVTALKSLDAEFEAVSASLKVPFYKTFAGASRCRSVPRRWWTSRATSSSTR